MLSHSRRLLRVLFLCRGSTTEGLGHVIRSRTVAAEMAMIASVRMLVVGDRHADALLTGQVTYEIVPDESQVTSRLKEFKPDVVIFDALAFDQKLVASINESSLTVSLSPIFTSLSDMDMVFHRTKYLGDDWQPEDFQGELRCGLEYSVIRQQCSKINSDHYRENAHHEPLAVAISMGGGDASNKTLALLHTLRSIPEPLLIWVLLGEAYSHSYDELVNCVKEDKRHEIILAKTGNSMWRVMRECAVGILAGGTVSYEAAYAGLPCINLFEQQSHVYLVRELVEAGVSTSAGFPFSDAIPVAAAQLRQLERDRSQLVQMHEKCAALIPAGAASRISREIVEHFWNRASSDQPGNVVKSS